MHPRSRSRTDPRGRPVLVEGPFFNPAGLKNREDVGSRLVAALESAYNTVRRRFPEIKVTIKGNEYVGHIPEAVIVISSQSVIKRKLPAGIETVGKYGHFAAARWIVSDGDSMPEIMVAAEGLQRDSRDVLATLVHEAAHGVAYVMGVDDTSNRGRYHNKIYKQIAEELGLVVLEPVKVLGHTNTQLPKGEYQEVLEEITPLLEAYREFEIVEIEEPRKSREFPIRCLCNPARTLRVFRGVYDQGPIFCGVCHSSFEEGVL